MLSPELPIWLHIQPLLWSVIFASSPCIFYLLSAVMFSQGKSSLHFRGWGASAPSLLHRCYVSYPQLCQGSLHAFRVSTPFTLGSRLFPSRKIGLLTCHYYAKYRKHRIIHYFLPPIKFCGEYTLLFSGDSHTEPCYNSIVIHELWFCFACLLWRKHYKLVLPFIFFYFDT